MDDAAPTAAERDSPERWWRLVVGAAACTAGYLAATISAYLLAQLGGQTLAGALAGMAAISVLAVVTVRLATELAGPAARVSAAIVGTARSHRVGSAVSAQVGFLVVLSPILTAVGHSVGFHGTTNIGLHHRAAALVLLLTWIAVVVAPWMEEVSMRGFLLSGLTSRFGFWPAAVASSLVWAGLHGVSGVLVPFTAEGIVLCWIRRRTGSVRTGIALHGFQNLVASIVSGAGWLAAPALLALVLSLAATRDGGSHAYGDAVGDVFARAARAADGVTGRIAVGTARPAVWILAGAALSAGVVLEAASLELAGGHGALTAGRILIAIVSLPPLGWLLLTAGRPWRAPAAACLAGAAGCAVVAAARIGVIAGSTTLVPLVGIGYTLAGLGLLGLAASGAPVRARVGAGVAGLLLLVTLIPAPYVITSGRAMVDQSLLTTLGAAAALIAVGLELRRPGGRGPERTWGAAATATAAPPL
jgi:membrane protease YdiL (CAAX protease family)